MKPFQSPLKGLGLRVHGLGSNMVQGNPLTKYVVSISEPYENTCKPRHESSVKSIAARALRSFCPGYSQPQETQSAYMWLKNGTRILLGFFDGFHRA